MLRQLTIENYALIRKLNISFEQGFSVITGETGAGKSIILGALGLILGERADSGVLLDKNIKCIVEGVFDLKAQNLERLFIENDIDYDDVTIIRREVNPAGKSRAFINDTPVNLNQLKTFGDSLVDIHSQHENLLVKNSQFQMEVVDNLAGNRDLLSKYTLAYKQMQQLAVELEQLKEAERQSRLDEDYYRFLLNELDQAKLEADEHELLENELNILSHAEEIKSALYKSYYSLNQSEPNALEKITESIISIQSFAAFIPELEELFNRLQSCYVELKDVAGGIDRLENKVTFNPEALEETRQRLDLLFSLEKKHRVNNTTELLAIRDNLSEKLSGITTLSESIEEKQKYLTSVIQQLETIALNLTKKRVSISKDFENQAVTILQRLGMPDAKFLVKIESRPELGPSGKDHVKFLFNANKGSEPGEISRIASGGELSRVMLAIKSLVSTKLLLPTIIFDEIDLGISGKVADMAGNILQELSKGRQVLAITHLPQIASKGNRHYFVYKHTQNKLTTTDLRLLSDEERVSEIANMMSGETVSSSAIEAAKELLSTIRR